MNAPANKTAAHEVVLVRHGETEWTQTGQHTSFTDISLKERGREHARQLGAKLGSWDFALVLSSPMQRAQDTCRLAGLGDRMQIDADLMEWNYGEYEGRTTEDIRREVPDWNVFMHPSPGGETAEEVEARADRVIARAVAASGPVALFSHGHMLRVIGARWIGLRATDGRLFAMSTASTSVLGYEHEQRVMERWNT